MNKKWSEKTTLQKVMDIISGIALCVWLILEMLENTYKMQWIEYANYIAICVICVCEAVSFWNVKRSLSYVAIAGIVFLIAVIVMQIMLMA